MIGHTDMVIILTRGALAMFHSWDRELAKGLADGSVFHGYIRKR